MMKTTVGTLWICQYQNLFVLNWKFDEVGQSANNILVLKYKSDLTTLNSSYAGITVQQIT